MFQEYQCIAVVIIINIVVVVIIIIIITTTTIQKTKIRKTGGPQKVCGAEGKT